MGSEGGLVRTLGLFTTITIVVGGVIGSGIFKKPGIMAAQVGSPEVLLLVWVLGGIITVFGAMSLAELSSMVPETGGQYVQFDRIYGPFAGYLFGWSNFAVMITAGNAALAYVCAEALGRIVPLPDIGTSFEGFALRFPIIGDVTPFKDSGIKLVALAIITGLTVVNYLGVKLAGIVQIFATIAKVFGMLLLVGVAIFTPGVGQAENFTNDSATIHPAGLGMIVAIAAALQGAFWAYDGWNKVTFIAGEVKNPQRAIPLGLVFGMLFVMAIYLSMTLAYIYVMPIDEMAGSRLVAADVADRCVPGGGKWISVAIALSTFGACNAGVLVGPRVFLAMARRNVFPHFLAAVNPRFHTPAAALLVQGVWTLFLLFTGTFDTLTDMLIFVSWIFYAASAYGVFVLRRREPDTPRPFRVPGYPVVPFVFVLAASGFLVMTLYNEYTNYQRAMAAGQPAFLNCVFGTLLVLAGTPFYFYYRRKYRTTGITP